LKDKILITGATGFVGRNLSKYLEKDNYNINLINRDELISCSVGNLKSSDAIIHLAGMAHDIKKTSDPNKYYEVNFEITKRLYDAFLKSDSKKFIFISSVKAAADVVNGILTEEFISNPSTHYGKSKLMAEEYIQSQVLPSGKSYYILRPCMVHGPGNKGNLNLLYKFVSKGIPYPLAGFQNQRSFLSIENLCFIIAEILRIEVASGVYNVADDESLSTTEVFSILAESLNKKSKLWKLSPVFLKFIAKIGDKIKFPLNTERLNKLTENYIVSNKKIKEAINSPLPITSREGLLNTANSFRED
jgi:nucleoside-diphosphate-sugar epimerase